MRKKTGTIVKTKLGLWQAVVTLADGSRKRLPPFPKGTSEAMAREKAAHYAEKAAALSAVVAAEQADEAEAWWADYHQHRDGRGLLSVVGIWRKHLWLACSKHPRDITIKDCEAVRDALDAKIHKSELSAKSALNAWTVWTTAMKAAAGRWKRDKPRRFKVRDDDPCQGVAPPDESSGDKELQWLLPREYSQLMASERVSALRQARYAIATFLFTRGGELKALDLRRDYNQLNGVISIRHSYDQERKEMKGTKTGNSGNRELAVHPNIKPLLDLLLEVCPVIDMPLRHFWADQLRTDLQLAGVTRAALFADPKDPTRRRVRFHDLRSSGLTWLAIQGVDAHKIQRRAGHSTFEMTQKYLRAAEVAGTDIGEPFPPLPAGFIDRLKRSLDVQVRETVVGRLGLEPHQDHQNRVNDREILTEAGEPPPASTGPKSAKPGRVIERSDHQITPPSVASFVAGDSPLLRLLERAGQADRASLPGIGAELAQLCRSRKAAS
jgi:integrase